MNRRDPSASVRELVPAVDLGWDDAPVCESPDCTAHAGWIVGFVNGQAGRFCKSRLACTYHMRLFCKQRQVKIPRNGGG